MGVSQDAFMDADTNTILPSWNLDALFSYDGYGSESYLEDDQEAEKRVKEFAEKYEGKVGTLTGDQLAEAIVESNAIDSIIAKMYTYAYCKNTQDAKAHSQNLQATLERITELGKPLIFFADELKSIPAEHYSEMLRDSEALRKWEPVIEDIIKAVPHKVDPKIVEYKSELGAQSFIINMYTQRRMALRFKLDGEELNTTEISKIIADDPDQDKRARANEEFERVMADDAWFNADIHNGLIKFQGVDSRIAKFSEPQNLRHHSNNIAPEIVDALKSAVKDSYEQTSHRFYALKARLMGQEQLNIYDRNVNVLSESDEADISWDDAKKIVLDAYYGFDARAGEVAEKFFDERWIDAAVSKNKQGGAYAHPGAAQSLHPLVMVNYMGKANDVSTLAHELGHGIHQYLAAPKGDAIVGTPLTLAETASVFGEMMVFKSLMRDAENDDQRRKLLFDKVNSMLNTVTRQISFYDFETRTHGQRKETGAPLTKEDFMRHWNDVAKESFGPAVKVEDSYGPVFGYIPHLVKTPFYVYAYAFGDSLVNALYEVYEEGTIPEDEFKDKYFAMLEAGGTYKIEDFKDDFGLDIADPEFWKKGLNMIGRMIDELEQLCEPLLQAQPNAPAN